MLRFARPLITSHWTDTRVPVNLLIKKKVNDAYDNDERRHAYKDLAYSPPDRDDPEEKRLVERASTHDNCQ